MKVLVTGANGLVGSHFIENYSENSEGFSILSPTQQELDITNKASVEEFFSYHKPDVIINFAAFTDVSKAEEQRDDKNGSCWIINVNGTANLVSASKDQAYFIQISTDVVFSGSKDNPGPYTENYPSEENSESLSWYGWTKKEAEKLLVGRLEKSAILRISNPVRAKYEAKLDYVRKIINLYDTDKLYPMFDDQFLTLTYIDEVTESLKALLKKRLTGIYHVSSTNLFTPHKLANYLIERVGGTKNAVASVSIEEFLKDNPSRYPQYGGLKVNLTQKLLNLEFKTWEEIIDSLVRQLST